MRTLASLEHEFPALPWRKPLLTTVEEVTRLSCRVCIANHGLRAKDVVSGTPDYVMDSDDEFDAHMAEAHGVYTDPV